MTLAVDSVVLLSIWDFLGTVYITSDIQLASQSHAVERQFNKFHVLIDEQARHLFETVYSDTGAQTERTRNSTVLFENCVSNIL